MMGQRVSKINGLVNAVNALQKPSDSIFSDERLTPLIVDQTRMMQVVFCDWEKQENFVGIKEISADDIIATQPRIQANKILRIGEKPVNTSTVSLLQIGDKYYLGDGNHKIVAAILQGNNKIKARIYRER